MFGTVAAAGVRIIASQPFTRKSTLVVALSLSLGLSVELMPQVLGHFPPVWRSIFSSGITTGASQPFSPMPSSASVRTERCPGYILTLLFF